MNSESFDIFAYSTTVGWCFTLDTLVVSDILGRCPK